MLISDEEWIARYQSALHSSESYAQGTVASYERDLSEFTLWLATYAGEQPLAITAVQTKDIRAWLQALQQQQFSITSIKRKLSSIRRFYNFLVHDAALDFNPVAEIRSPKSVHHTPATLDTDSIEQLLHIEDEHPIAIRDRALMELFYSSGLRLAELVGLNISDLAIEQQQLQVTGKANRQRLVPVGQVAMQALEKWLIERVRMAAPKEDALFVSKRGKRLQPRTIQFRLHYWGEQQGLNQHVHPHKLRHSFAKHMLDSAADPQGVQEMLGHVDVSTTQIYTQFDFQQVATIYDKTHPRARRK